MSSQQTTKSELPSEEKEIVNQFLANFGERAKLAYAKINRVKFTLDPSNLVEAAVFVRDRLHFDHCTNVTGTDFPKDSQIQVDYQFGSIDGENLRRIILTLSARVSYQNLKLHSLVNEFPSVELHEREAFEMLGLVFDGHPELSRLLLPEDWTDIPPMLKKYRLPGRLEGE
jgi:NADH-quinone oxidoreductase subunit C